MVMRVFYKFVIYKATAGFGRGEDAGYLPVLVKE